MVAINQPINQRVCVETGTALIQHGGVAPMSVQKYGQSNGSCVNLNLYQMTTELSHEKIKGMDALIGTGDWHRNVYTRRHVRSKQARITQHVGARMCRIFVFRDAVFSALPAEFLYLEWGEARYKDKPSLARPLTLPKVLTQWRRLCGAGAPWAAIDRIRRQATNQHPHPLGPTPNQQSQAKAAPRSARSLISLLEGRSLTMSSIRSNSNSRADAR